MVGGEQTVEDDRLGFPTWGITVHLTALYAAISAQKKISPGNTVPTALRRKPHEFLVGSEAEILVEPGRVIPHQGNQLLIHCPDALGSALQGIGLQPRHNDPLQAKAWPAIAPGIVEYACVVEEA